MAEAGKGDAQKALQLYQAGVPMARVAEQAGYSNARTATTAVKRLLQARGTVTDPELVLMAAMDRMDRMLQAVWPGVLRGDVDAVRAAQQLEERRVQLLALSGTSKGGTMQDAVDEALAALDLHASDAAAMAAARRVAVQMDQAAAVLDPTVQTKAAYLTPHLMNALRELGATPAARAALKNGKGGESGKSAKLTALRGGGRPAAAGA